MRFLIQSLLLLVFTFGSVQAHDIPPEILTFLAENPDATEAEFQEFISSIENGEELILWGEEEDSVSSFNLPPELVEFLLNNPEANEPEIIDFIESSPALKDTNWAQDINVLLSGNGFSDGSPFALNDLVLLNQVQSTFDEVYEVPNSINWLQFAKNYIVLGVEHILEGVDHVLFVLALVLMLPPWRRILGMVTIFTAAHSVTLILGGTEILTLSGRIVEPVIAASIAYVALTTVFLAKKYPWFADTHNRLMVIFAFGLFHGLGFAGIFSEVAPDSGRLLASLLFFNVGVEIGQLIILCFTLPILWVIYKLKFDRYIIPVFALLMSGLALWWVIVRIFF